MRSIGWFDTVDQDGTGRWRTRPGIVLALNLILALTTSRVVAGAVGDAERLGEGTNFNLILISLTNTRADHLGCYGYARETSPNLDKLARQSLVFENAFSHASWTLPAVISLFTSQYPFTHGMMNREEAQPLPQRTVTFLDVLKTNGYTTAAFVGDRDYSPRFGHISRFGAVYDPVRAPDHDDWRSYGVLENVLPAARAWLKENRAKKFFMLVQAYDTHCPFGVPKLNPRFDPDYRGTIDFTKCYWTFEKTRPLRQRAKNGRYEEVYVLKTRPGDGDSLDVLFHPEDVRHMIALYDGEIANADAQLGQLLDDVAALGLQQKTIVVFYADHGDMFGKHGRFMRGGPLRGTFYDDVLRIPLLIRHPAMAPRRVDGLAQLIDLGPTLLEMVGCEVPGAFRGKSLRPLLTRATPVNERVFAGAAFTPSGRNPFFKYHSTIYGVRDREWKLIYEKLFYSVGPQEYFELYNVRQDPQELNDLSSRHPEQVAALKRALNGWLAEINADAFKP